MKVMSLSTVTGEIFGVILQNNMRFSYRYGRFYCNLPMSEDFYEEVVKAIKDFLKNRVDRICAFLSSRISGSRKVPVLFVKNDGEMTKKIFEYLSLKEVRWYLERYPFTFYPEKPLIVFEERVCNLCGRTTFVHLKRDRTGQEIPVCSKCLLQEKKRLKKSE